MSQTISVYGVSAPALLLLRLPVHTTKVNSLSHLVTVSASDNSCGTEPLKKSYFCSRKDRLNQDRQNDLRQQQKADLRQVAVDFVAVEVSVVGVAVGVVHPDCLVAGIAKDADTMGHDPGLVQGGLPVDQHAVGVVQMSPHLHGRKPNARYANVRPDCGNAMRQTPLQ